MNLYEITVTVLLKKDIYFADCGYIIGKNINKLMLLDQELKQFHPKKEFKNYVFNSFYPLEKDKFYKRDKLYIFKIRGLDEIFMKKMYKILHGFQSNEFVIMSADETKIKRFNIKELYSINPVIITIDNKPWMQENDLNIFKQRLEANLEKKYKNFYNEEINSNGLFIKDIEFKNRMPMYFNYKNIRFLANKVSIKVEDNEVAQKLAFLAMATGLGEKNSAVGAGFCIGK